LISYKAKADSFSAANLKGWLDIVAAGGFDAVRDREVEMIEAVMAAFRNFRRGCETRGSVVDA
jgi:hypothetical protein